MSKARTHAIFVEKSWTSVWRDGTYIFFGIVFACLLLVAFAPVSDGSQNEFSVRLPWISLFIGRGLLIAAFAVFIWSGWLVLNLNPENLQKAVMGFVLVLGVFPSALLISALRIPPSRWRVQNSLTTDKGDEFAFVSNNLTGIGIAKATGTGFFKRSYQVLATTPSDPINGWASIIRPESAEDAYGQIYLGPDNVLLCVKSQNKCFMTYDLDTGIAVSGEDIKHLSPFACLFKNTVIFPDDVEHIRNEIDRCIAFHEKATDKRHQMNFLSGEAVSGCPVPDTLQSGLSHPNPAARLAAVFLDRVSKSRMADLRASLSPAESNTDL